MKPLAVAGNVNVDLIMGPVTPWPAPGTEIIVDHNELRVGGAAGNTALAWMAMRTPFTIAANIGNDEFGRWLAQEFGHHGENWTVCNVSTTLSVGITHPDGERTFLTTRGHLPLFSLANVQAALDVSAMTGGILLVCGSFLTDTLTRDYDALFDWADEHGIAIALDTGWPLEGWTTANRDAARRWLGRSRIALLNEIESTQLTASTDPVEAARALRSLMPAGAVVVIKRGPEGALALDASGQVHCVAAPKVSVIDTIGAGDVFNAGFLAALAGEKTLQECLGAGVSVASRAISTFPRVYENAIEGISA